MTITMTTTTIPALQGRRSVSSTTSNTTTTSANVTTRRATSRASTTTTGGGGGGASSSSHSVSRAHSTVSGIAHAAAASTTTSHHASITSTASLSNPLSSSVGSPLDASIDDLHDQKEDDDDMTPVVHEHIPTISANDLTSPPPPDAFPFEDAGAGGGRRVKDEVEEMLYKLNARSKEVHLLRNSNRKELEHLRMFVKKVSRDTDELLRNQQANLSAIGKKL